MDALFAFKKDLLKWELDNIKEAIGRIDTITNSIKNWAVIVWGGSIGLILQTTDLREYVAVTFLLPLIFLLVDARWRVIQRRAMYRLWKISEFINGSEIHESFKNESFDNFIILDPMAKKARDDDYEQFTSIKKVMSFGSVSWLYFGLSMISLIVGIIIKFFA
jgi:hypothetical protein